ncbi:hypothetical protein HK101_000437 [Irineochytrium annulatum]|nr:hypothetical protein HK101_000437 [Irineochytrium annulatum]
MQLLAISLDLDRTHFRAFFHPSPSTLRLIRYPPSAALPPSPTNPTSHNNNALASSRSTEKLNADLSCGAHTDSGILTLLMQDPRQPGLEVLNSQGQWIDAPCVPGSIVVNIGDLMSRWTRGRLVATFHRVRKVEGERFSVPFFFEPAFESVITPIGGGVQEGVEYGEYLREKMREFAEYKEDEDMM